MRLKGKVAIITGAGRGLGRAFSLALAKEGCHCAIVDIDKTVADKVNKEVQSFGCNAITIEADVSNNDDVKRMINKVVNKLGEVDILINNAGILRDKTIIKMEESNWDIVLDVHLKGTFACTRAAARVMKEQGIGGRIINTISAAGLLGNFGQSNYGSAKAGIVGFTINAAIELERYNINVNCIAPMALTRMKSLVVTEEMSPERITPMVLFLASDKGKHITGHIIGIHGQQLFQYQIIATNCVEKDSNDLWTVDEIAEKWEEITKMR